MQFKYDANINKFNDIPGSIFGYWISNALINDFVIGEKLKSNGDTRQGMATSDNNRFLRLWFEINYNKILFNKDPKMLMPSNIKWIPYNKGGEYRKWYGNMDYLINWENDGYEVKNYAFKLYKSVSRTIKSLSEYFKPCISWSKISSGNISFRYYNQGFIFDVAGCCIFYQDKEKMMFDFAFVNSKVSQTILRALSPTLNYEAGQIASLPIIHSDGDIIHSIVNENISIGKKDWDSFETSWDFKKHPLI